MSSAQHTWAVLSIVLLGCEAHGRASASIAAPSVEAQAHADVTALHVRFVAGKLAYTGAINFETGKAELVGDGTFRTLDSMTRYLDAHPEMKVRVEGHTDDVGTDPSNLLLSRRRAGAVRGWLEKHGIAADRLSSVGYGESRPIASNDTEEGRAKNRRVEFVVIEGAPPRDEPEPVDARASEPAPAPAPVAAETSPSPGAAACPDSRIGFHANALGPLGVVGADFAYQPACWVELAAGLSYDHANADASTTFGRASAGVHIIAVPLRARFWLLRRHSPILDLGLGLVRYDASGSESSLDGQLDYKRTGSVPFAFAGAGYGFRSDGAFRFAVLVGAVAQPGSLDPSDVTTSVGYSVIDRAALRGAMDDSTDSLLKPRPWLEASFGWLYP